MKAIVFTSDLETGIQSVDEQHRQLFAWGAAVLEHPETLADTEAFVRVYRDLAAYARFHFASEEAGMRKFDYDRLEAHRVQHQKFRDEFSHLYDRARASGPTKEIQLRTHFVLTDWFIYHIKDADRRLAEHIRTRMLEEEDTLPGIHEMREAGVDVSELLDTPVRVVKPRGTPSPLADRVRKRNR